MRLFLIAAIAENGVIGDNGKLPWGRTIPRDMDRFKAITEKTGVVLMGRKTAETLRGPLPGRRNLVLSRSNPTLKAGFEVFPSLEAVNAALPADQWVAVIGGGEVYRLCATHAHRALLTRVHECFEGDATYPIDSLDSYTRQGAAESFPADEKNAHALTFYSLKNTALQDL
jgi:dihydrofolate reductase